MGNHLDKDQPSQSLWEEREVDFETSLKEQLLNGMYEAYFERHGMEITNTDGTLKPDADTFLKERMQEVRDA